jgi:thiol:disulfide interchange protein DsbC
MKMRLSMPLKFVIHLLILCLLVGPVLADESKDKKGCASITAKELQELLVKINAGNATVSYIRESSLAGICEVAIEREGQASIFYIDAAKTHLFFGSLVDMKTMANYTMQSLKAIQDKKKIDISKIPLDNALVLGDAAAAKKVIIFTDPDCPYCSNLHQVLKQITGKRKDISFYIKLFPLEMHKDAYWKSRSIVCNKSLQLLEDCFNIKEIEKKDCNTDEIDNNLKLAKSLGITGTPAIILPDGRLRMGALPEEELINLIDGKM